MPAIALTPRGFVLDGRPALIQAGTLSYLRLPHPDLWRPALERLRMAGCNTVVFPVPWAYHSPAAGMIDFTGLRDLPRLLSEAERAGLWVVIQAGPWLGGGLDRGGLPGWLTGLGIALNDESPAFLRQLREWWEQLWPVVRRCHTLLAVQVHGMAGDAGMMALARQTGPAVPILGWDDARLPRVELQFPDGWGGQGAERLRRQLDPWHPIGRVAPVLAGGAAGYVLDPFAAGCTWGYWGPPESYTAYGNGAPVLEGGLLDEIYFRTRRWAMTVETLGEVLAGAEPTDALYASEPGALTGAFHQGKTALAWLYAGEEALEGLRLSWPVDDEVWTTAPFNLAAGSRRLLPFNWPLAGGMLRTTTLEPVLRVTVAGRDLLIVCNDGGGELLLSDDFRPRHAQGPVRTLRGAGGLTIRIEPERVVSLVLDGPRGMLQILALEPGWASRIWPLDDAWRTTPAAAPTWAPDPQEPARGLLFGPEWLVPRPDGGYAFGALARGFGYRWGPWRGSNPQTWLAPLSWEAPAPVRLPDLTGWESRAAAPEVRPDYDDREWREVLSPTPLAMEAQGVFSGLIWYRGRFSGPAAEMTWTCRHGCDLFLNGELIAVSNVLPGTPESIDPVPQTIPLPARLMQEENSVVILAEGLGHLSTPAGVTAPNGLLSFSLQSAPLLPEVESAAEGESADPPVSVIQAVPCQWRVRGGLSGERGQQGFPGFAEWERVPESGDEAVTWHRFHWAMGLADNLDTTLFLIVERLAGKAFFFLNGQLIGRYWEAQGPQRRFWLPDGLLQRRGENALWVVQWLRGAEAGPGRVRLEAVGTLRWYSEPGLPRKPK